mgnify:CR=1 FL=1
MHTTTESTPLLTQKYSSTIASLLTPGQWYTEDESFRSDYQLCERGTIAYFGDDPLLQGAAITGLLSLPHRADSKVGWSCNMNGAKDGAYRFLVDCLTYNERQAWIAKGGINISASKTPAQVAKDLQRRLLSSYLPAYRAGMDGWQREQVRHAANVALAEELAGIIGSEVQFTPGESFTPAYVWSKKLGGSIAVDGSVRFQRDFVLSAEEARDLFALLAKWKEREGQ